MNKTIKRNVVVSAILAIMLCVSLIAGATFALFTSESKVNIAVTSGKVDVKATIGELTLSSTVGGVTTAGEDGKWVNGGTATVDGDTITLDKMMPGDTVSFDITVTNYSNVAVKTRTIYTAQGELLGALTIEGFGEVQKTGVTLWRDLGVGSADEVYSVSITLDENAGNEYQEKSAAITFGVEAVQGNAQVDDPFTVRYGDTEEKHVSLKSALDAYEAAEASDVVIDVAAGTYYDTNVVVKQIANKNLAIKANGNVTFVNDVDSAPVFVVDAGSRPFNTYETLTFDGLNFELDNGAFGVQFGSGAIRYARNITVENCSFVGTDNTAFAVQSGSGSNPNSVTVSNCTADGIDTFVSTYATALTVSNCTATNINGFVNNQPAAADTSVVNCNATVNGNEAGYVVRVNGDTLKVIDSTLTLESKCAFTTGAIVVRGATNVVLQNNTISATVADDVNGATATICQSTAGYAQVNSDRAYTLLTGYKSTAGFVPMTWNDQANVNSGYAIFNADGLLAFRDLCANNANLRNNKILLTADIDMENRTWNEVNAHYELTCKLGGLVFDGDGHTISNMNIAGKAMFHRIVAIDVVTFKNLTMENIVAYDEPIHGGNQFKAVFVGDLYCDIVFDSVTVSNTEVSGYWAIGAFVGRAGGDNSSVDVLFNNCHVKDFVVNAPYNYYVSSFVGLVNDYDTGADTITFTGSNTVSCFTVNAVLSSGNNTGGSIHTDVNEAENVTVEGYEVKFS